MALTSIDELRLLIAESVPSGGTEADTMVTDEQLQSYIDGTDTMTLAAVKGWEYKAGEYAALVDTSEGNSARAMSDLHKQALAMAAYFQDKAKLEGQDDLGNRRGRANIGVISRSGQRR